MIYLIADTHFFHENIIRICSRPFDGLEDMHKTLIGNWNQVVQPEDEVWFLGDFVMGQRDRYRDWVMASQLNGVKNMILGNHDYGFKVGNGKVDKESAVTYWRECGFSFVSANPVVLEDYYILSHQPIIGLEQSQIMANIHGHTHNVSLTGGNYYNVSADAIDFKPIPFDRIKEDYKNGST
jgi:calcineurin-like phosphoesterase family protein